MSNTEEFPSLKTLGSLITTSRYYAGIGSRATPGADTAFELLQWIDRKEERP